MSLTPYESLTPYQDASAPVPASSLPPVKPEARIGPRAIRAYDIRGVVGADIDAAGARTLGLSYAAYARARGLRRFVVGRDGRLSSPALERALIDGLAAGGAEVARIGLGPTPRIAFAVRELGFDGGLMVTASHNPPAENGFKLLLGTERLHGEALSELVATRGEPRGGGRVRDLSIEAAYVVRLAATAEGARPLRIAWDPGHGATADTVRRLTRRIPGGHILINAEVDGRFPAHHPDPSVAENLQALRQTVLDTKADLGLAFDGDGDRLGVVNSEGEILWRTSTCSFSPARCWPSAPARRSWPCEVQPHPVRGRAPPRRTAGRGPLRLRPGARGDAGPRRAARRRAQRPRLLDDCWDGADDASPFRHAADSGALRQGWTRSPSPAAPCPETYAAPQYASPAPTGPAPKSWPRSRAEGLLGKGWTPTCWTGSGWRRSPAGGCCGRRARSPC